MATSAQDALTIVEELQNLLLARATGGAYSPRRYLELREAVLDDPRTRGAVPRFVQTCRTADQFWAFISAKFATYRDRKTFFWEAFQPLIEALENSPEAPADKDVGDALEAFDVESVHRVWERALERRVDDPDGAITSARTLLETVCKHILDEASVPYEPADDLPVLYRKVAKQLNLDPADHADIAVKRILGGAHSVVEGLGALRNAMSDAHGKGKGGRRAELRHATLAVSLAGAVATFLVETWEKKQLTKADGTA